MKKLIALLSLMCCSLAGASAALAADSFPSKPITLIVPYAAGGGSDLLARAMGQAISQETGQNVIIDNRPGGSTVIGAQTLLSKPADGYTVMLNAASFVINPYLLDHLSYDNEKDFQPITELAVNPHVLVVAPQVPANNLKEFLAWAKAQNGKASFSSFGNGSSGHLGFAMLDKTAGITLQHVPYKGAAPATMAVLTGDVQATLGDVGTVLPYVKSGKLKALAVAGPARSPALPDVPTFAEAGLPGFLSQTWMGLLAKAGTPADRVARLNALFRHALTQPEVQQVLAGQGMTAQPSSPADFAAFMKAEAAKYKVAVKEAGAHID